MPKIVRAFAIPTKRKSSSHTRASSKTCGLRHIVPPATAAVLSIAPALPPALASATPPVGVNAVVLSKQSVNGKDYIVSDITIAPGGSTGWHTHRGEIFGIVKAGTLTHNASDCGQDGVYTAGQPITDPSGADHVHIDRNLGTTPVVLEVVYIDPAGAPTSDGAPNPGCDIS
jgi:quercetin dioxygenase-like cupin family protein